MYTMPPIIHPASTFCKNHKRFDCIMIIVSQGYKMSKKGIRTT